MSLNQAELNLFEFSLFNLQAIIIVRAEFIRALFMSLNQAELNLFEFSLFNLQAIIIVRAQLVY
jgi:hypothetical protein